MARRDIKAKHVFEKVNLGSIKYEGLNGTHIKIILHLIYGGKAHLSCHDYDGIDS